MKRSALIIILSVVTVASVLAAAWMFIEMQGALRQAGSAEAARALAERDRDAAREQLAQAPIRDVREQLAQQHAVREAGESAIKDLREQLAQARSEKEALQRSVNDLGGQLGQERSAREFAERALRDTRERLAMERTAREAAEVAVSETGEQLIQERTAREAAERAIKDQREQLAQQQRAIKDLRGGHRGLNDPGPVVDLGQGFLRHLAPTMSLAEARGCALELAAEVRKGRDPHLRQATAETFDALARQYMRCLRR